MQSTEVFQQPRLQNPKDFGLLVRTYQNVDQKTPGPCTYSKPDPLNDSGLYRVSWYRGNGKRVWNKEKRRSFIDAASKSAYGLHYNNLIGPGPG